MSKYPKYSEGAQCFHCERVILIHKSSVSHTEHVKSGYAKGHGEYVYHCQTCGRKTFYDL